MKTDNELIAEFMQDEKVLRIYKDPKYRDSDDLKYVKYHSSWDWLMPVVEKIHHSLSYDYMGYKKGVDVSFYFPHVSISFPDVSGGYDYVNAEWNNENAFDSRTVYDPKLSLLDNTYKAVVYFIKWYNENKKP